MKKNKVWQDRLLVFPPIPLMIWEVEKILSNSLVCDDLEMEPTPDLKTTSDAFGDDKNFHNLVDPSTNRRRSRRPHQNIHLDVVVVVAEVAEP